ncbi:amidase [Vibrio cionasavignyae]|uniref:amidase n=1 Tax=Vibrio cionasavignyae TaxID=2910252 RepID=UPI003D09A948
MSDLAKATGMDEFVDYDAIGLMELIKKGEVTASELLEVFISRADKLKHHINAVNIEYYDVARERAAHLTKDTPFAGVPILVKDMVDIGHLIGTDCSNSKSDYPTIPVPYTQAVESIGLNIFGRTNSPEFASSFNTWNERFGLTRNPWDPEKTVFGSSGGSSAAVAAGIAPLALGTDGAGSNRVPPNACGVFGFKPSRGRLLAGETGGVHDLIKTHSGISRSVRDNEMLFYHTQDLRNPLFKPFTLRSRAKESQKLRIGYIREGLPGYAVDPRIMKKQDKVAELCRSLGHDVVEVDLKIDGELYFQRYHSFYMPKFTSLAQQILDNKPSYNNEIMNILELTYLTRTNAVYGKKFTQQQVVEAEKYLLNDIPQVFEQLFDQYDVLLSAVCPIQTQNVGFINPMKDSFVEKANITNTISSLTSLSNICGHPSMSVPLSSIRNEESGIKMPLGSMFQAKSGDEEILYELAYSLESAKPWANKWPAISVKHL